MGSKEHPGGTTAGTADNSVNTGQAFYSDGGVGNKWLRAATPSDTCEFDQYRQQ